SSSTSCRPRSSSLFPYTTLFRSRANFIDDDIQDELYAYMGGIIRNFDCKLLIANGTANHGHLLVSMSKNHLVPTLVGAVKRDSSDRKSTRLNSSHVKISYAVFCL